MRWRSIPGWIQSLGLALVLTAASLLAARVRGVLAAPEVPPGPDRFKAILVDYTSYKWWLVGFQNNQVACEVFTDHEGLPDHSDVYLSCGQEIYDGWAATPACPALERGGSPSACPGYYLHFIGSGPDQKIVPVALPEPWVWVSLEGCTPAAGSNICSNLPVLLLTGDEPLPNEQIISIEGYMDGVPFTCGPTCELLIEPTDANGILLEFWAYSSYGDSSIAFEAQVRVAESITPDGETKSYSVDVLSDQWVGEKPAACAQTWEAFPPVEGLPNWLLTPEDPSGLASNIPYEYLAKNLIEGGLVNLVQCPDRGFLTDGSLSPCGKEAAQPLVEEWQNRFDVLILAAAQESGVPAQLLKNLFSRESQFWPGLVSGTPEVGLGQLTENGADTALLWNPSFYEQFCPLVLEKEVCETRYPHLDPEIQVLLRAGLVRSVDAFCTDCPLGIDLNKADSSIEIFAETLMGNCAQVGRIIRNYTAHAPGDESSYDDLWRFTLVNYNAGPGCLSLAFEETLNNFEPLDWMSVSSHLTPVCYGALDYVEDITRVP